MRTFVLAAESGDGHRKRIAARSSLLYIHDFKTLLEALDGISSGSWSPLVGHEPSVTKIGDSVCDEFEIELLRIINLLARRNAGDVDVADVIDIVAHDSRHIPIHDLNVIDVVDDLHAQ